MKVREFPLCCTAKVICDFGSSYLSEGIQEHITQEEIEEFITAQMKLYDHLGVMTAVTNTHQVCANKALRKLGFYSSEWMTSKQHLDSKIKLWWKPLAAKKKEDT